MLDGITQWNATRAQDAADTPMRTFDIRLQESVNRLSSSLGMPLLFEQFRMPMQTGSSFPSDINTAIDEGFDDDVDVDDDNVVESAAQEEASVLPADLPVDSDEDIKVRIKRNSHIYTIILLTSVCL